MRIPRDKGKEPDDGIKIKKRTVPPIIYDLQSCPFCGHEAIIEDHGDNGWYVGCSNTYEGCVFKPSTWAESRIAAISSWNKRKDKRRSGKVMKQKLWIVGKTLHVNGREIGWMPEGIYKTEEQAANAASEDEFIAIFEIGKRLPKYATDAEKLYFPKLEIWEDSKLYKFNKRKEGR